MEGAEGDMVGRANGIMLAHPLKLAGKSRGQTDISNYYRRYPVLGADLARCQGFHPVRAYDRAAARARICSVEHAALNGTI